MLSTSIDKYCFISIRHLPPFFEHKHRIVYSQIENIQAIHEIQHPAVKAVLEWVGVKDGLEVHHDGDLPARSGLGSSSSFTVGLIHSLASLDGRLVSKDYLASSAIHVEQNVIKENVGSQDQVAAAFGGFNLIEFHRDDSYNVTPMILAPNRIHSLESHLLLFFTGITRFASEIAESKIANIKDRGSELLKMRGMVDQAIDILQDPSESIDEFGRLLHQSWEQKRRLSSQVSNSVIDGLYERALDAGATGGKILGAGGGGFLLIFAKPALHESVKAALSGLVHVPFKFENSGSKVVVYEPNGL